VRSLIPLVRPALLPDPTRLVVGWTTVRHTVRDRGPCTYWICAEEARQGEGRRMAARLRDQAHDESHDRITEHVRTSARPAGDVSPSQQEHSAGSSSHLKGHDPRSSRCPG